MALQGEDCRLLQNRLDSLTKEKAQVSLLLSTQESKYQEKLEAVNSAHATAMAGLRREMVGCRVVFVIDAPVRDLGGAFQ